MVNYRYEIGRALVFYRPGSAPGLSVNGDAMKVGDLIKAPPCPDRPRDCECFFCYHESTRIGLIIGARADNTPWNWIIEFDCGEWEMSSAECEVISEGR